MSDDDVHITFSTLLARDVVHVHSVNTPYHQILICNPPCGYNKGYLQISVVTSVHKYEAGIYKSVSATG